MKLVKDPQYGLNEQQLQRVLQQQLEVETCMLIEDLRGQKLYVRERRKKLIWK
jgi:hypothetical protein